MAGGNLMLPGDFSGQLIDSLQKTSFEVYGEQPASAIPELFEVRQADQMAHGIYERESVTAGDVELKERQMGGSVSPGNTREARYVIHKLRFFERSYDVPEEMAKYVLAGNANALASLQAWASAQAKMFSVGRYQAEQKHAAQFFNSGGFTAGHDVFDNSIPGVVADPGGKRLYDAEELFNLTGSARTALNGTTYYNAVSLSLSATNLETLHELVGDTNGYSEWGHRIDAIPDKLIVPVSLQSDAERIVLADKLAGTANNDANPWRRYKVIPWAYLTDADAWFVMSSMLKPLVWWQGGAPDIKLYELPDNRSLRLSMQVAFAAQARDWRGIGASNVSTS